MVALCKVERVGTVYTIIICWLTFRVLRMLTHPSDIWPLHKPRRIKAWLMGNVLWLWWLIWRCFVTQYHACRVLAALPNRTNYKVCANEVTTFPITYSDIDKSFVSVTLKIFTVEVRAVHRLATADFSPWWELFKTRQHSYRKEDRAMRPIYGCPQKFSESSLRTRLLFQKFVMDFCSDRY